MRNRCRAVRSARCRGSRGGSAWPPRVGGDAQSYQEKLRRFGRCRLVGKSRLGRAFARPNTTSTAPCWVSLTLDPTYGYDSIPRAGRPVGLAPGIDRPERLADPGALVLLRLAAARFQQAVGVLVPGAVGEIVPEHGGGGLRFLDDAERHVAFGEPRQRFLDVAGALVLRHDHLEAVDRADEVLLLHIVAPDVHLLGGELVARHLDLLARSFGVFRIREFARDLLERRDC